jgi:aliphatic sulfonates family ABC transporter substrate-binding protein
MKRVQGKVIQKLRIGALLVFVLLTAPLVFGGPQRDTTTKSGNPPASEGEKPVKIRFAVQAAHIQPFVAEKLGYFKDEGLDVELVIFSYGPPIIEAFTSRNVDLGTVGDLPAYSGIGNGIDIKIVAIYGTSDTYTGIVVRDAANIRSFSDLKGKKVSVGFGSNNQPLLYQYLELGKLTENDVEIINLSFGDGVSSILAGRIDATVVSEPFLSQAIQGGGVSLFATTEGIRLFVSPVIARGEFTNAYPQQTAKFLRALDRAGKWANEHPDEAAKIVADTNDGNVEALKLGIIKRQLNLAVTPERYEALVFGADVALKYGLLTQKIDVPAHVDLSYLKAAGVQ